MLPLLKPVVEAALRLFKAITSFNKADLSIIAGGLEAILETATLLVKAFKFISKASDHMDKGKKSKHVREQVALSRLRGDSVEEQNKVRDAAEKDGTYISATTDADLAKYHKGRGTYDEWVLARKKRNVKINALKNWQYELNQGADMGEHL